MENVFYSKTTDTISINDENTGKIYTKFLKLIHGSAPMIENQFVSIFLKISISYKKFAGELKFHYDLKFVLQIFDFLYKNCKSIINIFIINFSRDTLVYTYNCNMFVFPI